MSAGNIPTGYSTLNSILNLNFCIACTNCVGENNLWIGLNLVPPEAGSVSIPWATSGMGSLDMIF